MAHYEVDGLTLFVELKQGYARCVIKEVDAYFVGYNESAINMTIRNVGTISFVNDYNVVLLELHSKNTGSISIKLCSSAKYNAYRELKYMMNEYNGLNSYEQIAQYKEHMASMKALYKSSIKKNQTQQNNIKQYIDNKQKESLELYQVTQERDRLIQENIQLEKQITEFACTLSKVLNA